MYDDKYFHRNIAETWFRDNGLLRPDQLAALCYALDWPFWAPSEKRTRNPEPVLSIGCGMGELEVVLENMGYRVIGYDPFYADVYKGKECIKEFTDQTGKTVIFCESIEHIEKDEIKRIIAAHDDKTRIIITNWPDFHPIPKSNFDHITEINDEFFDELLDGRTPIIRRGSHLVYEL